MSIIRERIHITRSPHCTHTHITHVELVSTEIHGDDRVEFQENTKIYGIIPMFGVLILYRPPFLHALSGTVTHQAFEERFT